LPTSIPRFNCWFEFVQAGVHDQLWQSFSPKETVEKQRSDSAVTAAFTTATFCGS